MQIADRYRTANGKLLLKVADERDRCTIAVVFLRPRTGFRSHVSHQPKLHHCLRPSRWVAYSGTGGGFEGWPQPDGPNFSGWRLEFVCDASRLAAMTRGISLSSLSECGSNKPGRGKPAFPSRESVKCGPSNFQILVTREEVCISTSP